CGRLFRRQEWFCAGKQRRVSTTPVLSPGGSASCLNVGALGVAANVILPANTFPSTPFATQVTGSDVNDWFIALDQNFEAAAFHLYAVYQHFDDPTLPGLTCR